MSCLYLIVCGAMFETRKSYACSKSIEKTPDSFPPFQYGFFSVDIEYVRQYKQFGTKHLSVKHFGQGLVPGQHLRD